MRSLCILMGLMLTAPLGVAAADRADERELLMAEVAGQMASYFDEVGGVQGLAPAVDRAMLAVPRHEFVPEGMRPYAYENRPLPIGHGQTISQPFIVALMSQLLEVRPGDRVLELGTGSGYQAAVLAAMGVEVYSMEVIEPLGAAAARRFDRLGYRVETRVVDGYYGWPAHAPYDAIIVTAAASQIPPPLIRQLAPGGIMAIPVGAPFTVQQLLLVTKDEEGVVTTRGILAVRFVPLTGDH